MYCNLYKMYCNLYKMYCNLYKLNTWTQHKYTYIFTKTQFCDNIKHQLQISHSKNEINHFKNEDNLFT